MPDPTQLRDFYAGTVLGHLEQAQKETEAAMEAGIIRREWGTAIVRRIIRATVLVEWSAERGVEPSSSEAETRVMK